MRFSSFIFTLFGLFSVAVATAAPIDKGRLVDALHAISSKCVSKESHDACQNFANIHLATCSPNDLNCQCAKVAYIQNFCRDVCNNSDYVSDATRFFLEETCGTIVQEKRDSDNGDVEQSICENAVDEDEDGNHLEKRQEYGPEYEDINYMENPPSRYRDTDFREPVFFHDVLSDDGTYTKQVVVDVMPDIEYITVYQDIPATVNPTPTLEPATTEAEPSAPATDASRAQHALDKLRQKLNIHALSGNKTTSLQSQPTSAANRPASTAFPPQKKEGAQPRANANGGALFVPSSNITYIAATIFTIALFL